MIRIEVKERENKGFERKRGTISQIQAIIGEEKHPKKTSEKTISKQSQPTENHPPDSGQKDPSFR